MSQDGNAVLIARNGKIFEAPAGTAYPDNPAAPASPWSEVGHTSATSPLAITRAGGERTPKGTWQNPNLRESTTPVTYGVGFQLLQQDERCLQLYYGGGQLHVPSGNFVPPVKPSAQERALFIVIDDEKRPWYRHFPKTSLLGSDAESFPIDDFAAMPVSGTILTPDAEIVSGLEGLFSINLFTTTVLEVTPATATISTGTPTQQLVATADGVVVTDTAVWTSSDPLKATVDAAGLVTRVATGSVTVTAAYGGKTDTCAVTISA